MQKYGNLKNGQKRYFQFLSKDTNNKDKNIKKKIYYKASKTIL